MVETEKEIAELKNRLADGYWPMRVNGCCVYVFTSALQWEPYKSFGSPIEAHNYVQLLCAIHDDVCVLKLEE